MQVVVVGAGVVGLTCAYRLAREGLDVVVLDGGNAGAAASHGNAAKITVAEVGPVPAPGVVAQGIRWLLKRDSPLAVHPSPSPRFVGFMLAMARHCNLPDYRTGLRLHLDLALRAAGMLDDYRADGVEFEMHSRGVLLAFETRERFYEHSAGMDVFEAFGLIPERMHGSRVQEREPVLSERIRHGLYFSGDRQVEPDSLTRGLLAKCRQLGVQIHEGTAVTTILRNPEGAVTTAITATGQEWPTDALVLAAGVSSGALSTQLGCRLPIHPGKGYSLDYLPAPVELRTSLTLEDARVAITPLNGMIRLAGTMEFGTRSTKVNHVRVDAIRRAARDALDGWGNPSGEAPAWAGLRPMTPDGRPVIGRMPHAPNAYAASGHGMLGLTLAPPTAEIITDLVTGKVPDLSADQAAALSPARFSRRASAVGI